MTRATNRATWDGCVVMPGCHPRHCVWAGLADTDERVQLHWRHTSADTDPMVRSVGEVLALEHDHLIAVHPTGLRLAVMAPDELRRA